MKKIIDAVYKLIKLLLVLSIVYLSYCTYCKFQNGWNSLTSFFQVPQTLKDFMNKPLGDPMVIDEQDAGVREVRDTGKVKVAPGAPRQNETIASMEKSTENSKEGQNQQLTPDIKKQISEQLAKFKKEEEKKQQANTVIQVVNNMPSSKFGAAHYAAGTIVMAVIIWWLFFRATTESNHKFSNISNRLPELPLVKLGKFDPKLNTGIGSDEEEDNDENQDNQEKGGDELGNQVLNVTKVQLNSYNFGDLPAAQERYNDNLDKLQLSDQSSSASQCATPKEKASNDEIVELDDKHQALPKEIMGPKAADNAIGGAFLIQFNEELQKKVLLAKYEAKLANYELQQKANNGVRVPKSKKVRSLEDLKKELCDKRALAARTHLAKWEERTDKRREALKNETDTKRKKDDKRHEEAAKKVNSEKERKSELAKKWIGKSSKAKEKKQGNQDKFDDPRKKCAAKWEGGAELPKGKKGNKKQIKYDEHLKQRAANFKDGIIDNYPKINTEDLSLPKINTGPKTVNTAVKKEAKYIDSDDECEVSPSSPPKQQRGGKGEGTSQSHTTPGDGPIYGKDGQVLKEGMTKTLMSGAITAGVTQLTRATKTVWEKTKEIYHVDVLKTRYDWQLHKWTEPGTKIIQKTIDTRQTEASLNLLTFFSIGVNTVAEASGVLLAARGVDMLVNGTSWEDQPGAFSREALIDPALEAFGTKTETGGIRIENTEVPVDIQKSEWRRDKKVSYTEKEARERWKKGKAYQATAKHSLISGVKSTALGTLSTMAWNLVWDVAECAVTKQYVKEEGRDGRKGAVCELCFRDKLMRRVKKYDTVAVKTLSGAVGSLAAIELVRKLTDGMHPKFQTLATIGSMAATFTARTIASSIVGNAYSSLKSFVGSFMSAKEKSDELKSLTDNIATKIDELGAEISNKLDTHIKV